MVKIFADIDAAGKCLGFYPDDVWPKEKRPSSAVEIAEDLWRSWIADGSQRFINGALVAGPTVMPSERDYADAIDDYADRLAKARDYKDANRLAGYIASTIPQYAEDATAFIAWRDAVWVYAYQLLGQVQAGQAPQPTIDGFIASLPNPPWPLGG